MDEFSRYKGGEGGGAEVEGGADGVFWMNGSVSWFGKEVIGERAGSLFL